MKFIPSETIVIKTKMSPSEIHLALKAVVEPKCVWVPSEIGKRFNGEFSSDGFKLMPISNSRNPFIPVIVGKIEETETGCSIFVKIRLNFIGTIAMALLLMIVVFVALNAVATAIIGKTGSASQLVEWTAFSVLAFATGYFVYSWMVEDIKPVILGLFNIDRQPTRG